MTDGSVEKMRVRYKGKDARIYQITATDFDPEIHVPVATESETASKLKPTKTLTARAPSKKR